jgi:outer membrane protein OmpA-like peptidoglycan-associated protein/tetratricopeptide (TPR) repeat protein
MKIKLGLLIGLCMLLKYANTQEIGGSSKPKAIEWYNKALNLLNDDAFAQALQPLQKAIAIDSNYIDAYLSLAGTYGELKQYKSASTYYEKAFAKDSNYTAFYKLPYAINLAGMGLFEYALQTIQQFLANPSLDATSRRSAEYRQKCFAFAVQYLQKQSNKNYVFNPINLGDKVNSKQSEYLPSLTVTDTTIVFTRRGERGGEYFYQSSYTKDKTFHTASLIPGSINEDIFKGALSISADGEVLVYAGNLENNAHANFDIYICYATPNGWSEPQNIGQSINTNYWESAPCLSPDKQALYFASNRPNGIGGSDLYVSYKDVKGNWTKAINMGESINTIGDETAPFIHSDNQTLYFTSTGLQGYGGSDLFVCRKGPYQTWSQPLNLGYPINTIENEGSLVVSTDGETAFYASDRSDTRGGLDLYWFTLRKDIQPYKTFYVKGFVYDAVTKKGIPSFIELINNNTGKAVMTLQTEEDGFYFTTLPTNANYTFVVNRSGYFYSSTLYTIENKLVDSTYRQNIFLQPIKENTSITLNNVLFTNNSFLLEEISKIELDKLFEVLQKNSSLVVSIEGHTDNIGNAETNKTLSIQRAKAVYDYLITKGIAANRLQYKGWGDTKPIANNTTTDGKAKNRRTEIVVLKM